MAFIFGAVVGSFVNVLIYRLPREESIVSPRSRCPACGHPIRAIDNVPILSWLILRGRCRDCGARISPRYPLVEALSGLLAVGLVSTFGLSPESFLFFALCAALLAVVFIDLDCQIIPDAISLPGIAVGLAASLFLDPGWPGYGLASSAIGAVGGGGLLFLVREGYWYLRRQEGMGFGDVKLLAMIGAWLGWRAVPMVLLLGSLSGALVGIGLMVRGGHDLKHAVPFGPFLVLGAYCYLFFGEELISWYLGLLG
jgi:leader peptidase (prepilin peptidase)/N-methyltransferase